MPLDRVDDVLLVARELHVEVDADLVLGEELQRLVEREAVLRHLAPRVRELQVGPDVELDEVRANVHRDLQRRERVLGCDRRRPTMADDERRPVPPPEVHVFLITTIAQSSPRFPPA